MIWKQLYGIVEFAFWILLFWMFWGRDGKRGSARVLSGDRIEFAPDRISFWGWLLLVASLVFSIVHRLMHFHEKQWDLLTVILLGLYAIGFLVSFPASIIVSGEGLEQVYWFRPRKRIGWSEIVEIEFGPKDRLVTVTGSNGTKIVHTRFLADRARLLQEIRRHCGEELPPDFPGEAIDGQ
jgi:hypothetical protein